MTNPVTAESDPLMDIDTNIRGSVQLFQQIVKLKTIKKIVYSSSGGTVYGEHDIQVPILETERTWPVSPYGIGKSAIENYLHYFNKKFAQPYTVFRIANPYGPRQPIFRKQGVIPIFADKIQNNQVIDIFGDGSMIRDYIYVKDVADAIAKSLTKDLEHSIYNIGSGTGHTITEIIDVLEKTLYTKAEKNYLESPSTFVHYSVLDHSRFTNEFPEIKLTTLEDGISKMIDSEKSV
jgi:UDP-glucose 4-epimerase